jgi:hypothetical protein
MRFFWRALTATVLCFFVPISAYAAEAQAGYSVVYSGGWLPSLTGGNSLRPYLATSVRLNPKANGLSSSSRDHYGVSYGQIHRRSGTTAGL